MKNKDILVIGAGISGLMCATELKKQGHRVKVIDKGRGAGGRMASRRINHGRADHGAQFFTVRSQRFQHYVDAWLENGIIREWFRTQGGQNAESGHPRYCGLYGMTDVPKHLATSLEVHQSTQATRLLRKSNRWQITTREEDCFEADELIITAPLPQAIALIETSNLQLNESEYDALKEIYYEKNLAVLAVLDGPSGLPEPGRMKVDSSPLSWLADNTKKGISPDAVTATIHSDSEFAECYWNRPDEERAPLLIEAAMPYLQANVMEYHCHSWAYTRPVNPWHENVYRQPDWGLTLAGDAFGGQRVEGAALSGLSAADCFRSF